MEKLSYILGISLSAMLGVTCVQALTNYAYNQLQKKCRNSADEVIATVLFFPDTSISSPDSENVSQKSLAKMLSYISSAQRTIDVCVMVFTCRDLANGLSLAAERGVRVRVILDHMMALVDGSKLNHLRRNGIAARTLNNISQLSNSEVINPCNANDVIDANGNQEIMHHKYAVIDASLVMTGSFNWTKSAALHNRENVTVTNLPSIVSPFQIEFDRLWSLAS